jgi:uncharacterized membrane protein HdeD (DUF308 family)
VLADTITQLSSRWWTFLIRGIVALIVAAFAFGAPGSTAAALVYIVAAYFIITGIASLVAGFSFSGLGHWWLLVLSGLVQAALGVVMVAQPGIGPLALAYLFAIWMIMSGVTEIAGAIALQALIKNEFWWILLGVITLAFGFYVILVPALGLLALVYTLGFYAIIAGVSLIAFAFRIRSAGTRIGMHAAAAR